MNVISICMYIIKEILYIYIYIYIYVFIYTYWYLFVIMLFWLVHIKDCDFVCNLSLIIIITIQGVSYILFDTLSINKIGNKTQAPVWNRYSLLGCFVISVSFIVFVDFLTYVFGWSAFLCRIRFCDTLVIIFFK
jgi:hypothetical protein